MNQFRRPNLKERLLDSNKGDYKPGSVYNEYRRVPSAGVQDFKISRNQSPNTSDLRQKKKIGNPTTPTLSMSYSLQHHIQKKKSLEKELTLPGKVTNLGNLIVQTPASNIQKKMKDMLGASQTEKSAHSSHKRVKSNSRLESSPKSKKIIHRKTPSAKLEIAPAFSHTSKDALFGLPPKPRDMDTKVKQFDLKNLIENSMNVSLNKTPQNKSTDGYTSKDAIKANFLYKKLSHKVQTKPPPSSLQGTNSEIRMKVQKYGVSPQGEKTSIDQNLSVQLNKVVTANKKEYGMHKRSDSENFKKLKIDNFTKNRQPSSGQKPSRGQSGAKRSPNPIQDSFSASVTLQQNTSYIGDERPRLSQTKESKAFIHTNNVQHSLPPAPKKKPSLIEFIKKHEQVLPPFESSKVIIKDFGEIKAFSVNTHQGVFRNYNEDRVSILLNAQQRYFTCN